MLWEIPPIVALPPNPADCLKPVPLFVRSTDMYETRLAHHCDRHNNNNIGEDNTAWMRHVGSSDGVMMGGTAVLSPCTNTPQPQLCISQAEQQQQQQQQQEMMMMMPMLPQAAPETEPKRVQSYVSPNEYNMDTLAEKDVDVLLEVLETRYGKYAEAKKRITERYLTHVERDVDHFLVARYGGGTSSSSSSSSRFGGGVASFIKNTLVSRIPSPQRTQNGGSDKLKGENGLNGNITSNGGVTIGGGRGKGGKSNDDGSGGLQTFSYQANAIPFNYLDVRPTNMDAIAANLVILRRCLEECFVPESSVRRSLLCSIARDVWDRSLRPLENSAKELLQVAEQNVWPPLEYFLSLRRQEDGDAAKWSERCGRYDRVVKALQDDLNYLHVIHEMDREVFEGTLHVGQSADAGLSDYVPVSGLVLSRLHRLENEHRTVLEFWRSR